MGQTDKPPSNLPEDSTVDEGAATLDRIERGLKETSRLVGDHLVWETIGDRASERAVEFLLDKRDVNESVEVKRAERARREDKERGDAERARLASIAGSNSSEVAPTGEHPRITSEGDPSRTGPRTWKNQVTRNANGATSRRRRRRTSTQHKEPSDGDSPDKPSQSQGFPRRAHNKRHHRRQTLKTRRRERLFQRRARGRRAGPHSQPAAIRTPAPRAAHGRDLHRRRIRPERR